MFNNVIEISIVRAGRCRPRPWCSCWRGGAADPRTRTRAARTPPRGTCPQQRPRPSSAPTYTGSGRRRPSPRTWRKLKSKFNPSKRDSICLLYLGLNWTLVTGLGCSPVRIPILWPVSVLQRCSRPSVEPDTTNWLSGVKLASMWIPFNKMNPLSKTRSLQTSVTNSDAYTIDVVWKVSKISSVLKYSQV